MGIPYAQWAVGEEAFHGDRVILHEAEPLFMLPVTIETTTAKGSERRTIWIREEETAFSFDGEVSNTRVDPDGLLLLQREPELALKVFLVAASPSLNRATLMFGQNAR